MKKSFLVIAIFSILLSLTSISLSVYMKFFETTESSEQVTADLGDSEIYEMCERCNPVEQDARWIRILGKELSENYEGDVRDEKPSCVFQGEVLEKEEIISDFPLHNGVMTLQGFNALFSIDESYCSDEDLLAGKTQIWIRFGKSDEEKSLKVGETHTLYVRYEEENLECIGEKECDLNSRKLIE